MRPTALLLALLPAFCALNAQAQDAEHEAWIRESTRSAIRIFAASGAPGLRKNIEACYAGADKKPDFNSFFLEAERCTAQDQLGTIIFLAQKTAQERPGRPINDSFFNPIAHQSRVDAFWSNRQMNEADKKSLIEKIFAVVYNEAGKSAPASRPAPASPTASAPPDSPASPASTPEARPVTP